ncbi:MAG: glycosyltransferase family 8 protein [Coprococcus sp.]|nr:glycosyltransferase family 8 protein [Coprococcus sp.]
MYHSSDLFAPVLGTSVVSVFENNKSFDEIHIYIFENPLSEDNKKKLIDIADSYARNIHFIPMPDINETQNLGLKDVRAGWFFNSYMKLYLDKLLPKEIHRVLYLDSDILVVDDLTELWNMDLKGHCAAGVTDCLGERYYNILGLSKKAYYCNSGMILEDLCLWREKNIGDKVRNYCNKNGGYVFFMEQTAFNAALDNNILIIHPKYNVYSMMQCLTYEELLRLRKAERFYTKDEIAEAVARPAIIHLTNSFLLINRAWYENSNHPCRDMYQEYKKLTPWKNEPDFPDMRKSKAKVVQFFVDHLPKTLVIGFASNLYNTWRVNRIRKTIMDAQQKMKNVR